jgi:hypothetical protein
MEVGGDPEVFAPVAQVQALTRLGAKLRRRRARGIQNRDNALPLDCVTSVRPARDALEILVGCPLGRQGELGAPARLAEGEYQYQSDGDGAQEPVASPHATELHLCLRIMGWWRG